MPSTAGFPFGGCFQPGDYFGSDQKRPKALADLGPIERCELLGIVGKHDRPSFTGQIRPVISACQWQAHGGLALRLSIERRPLVDFEDLITALKPPPNRIGRSDGEH